MTPETLLLLFAITAGLAALPSSSVILVVVRSATHGVPHGIAVTAGIVLGDLVFVLLALLGLSAAAEAMGSLFYLLKLLGGLYLIGFGISLLTRPRSTLPHFQDTPRSANILLSTAAGFLLTLSDVKAILFYASLFPVFIDIRTLGFGEMALIAATTVVSVGLVKLVYAIYAARIAGHVRSHSSGSATHRIAGGCMLGLGGYLIIKP